MLPVLLVALHDLLVLLMDACSAQLLLLLVESSHKALLYKGFGDAGLIHLLVPRV